MQLFATAAAMFCLVASTMAPAMDAKTKDNLRAVAPAGGSGRLHG